MLESAAGISSTAGAPQAESTRGTQRSAAREMDANELQIPEDVPRDQAPRARDELGDQGASLGPEDRIDVVDVREPLGVAHDLWCGAHTSLPSLRGTGSQAGGRGRFASARFTPRRNASKFRNGCASAAVPDGSRCRSLDIVGVLRDSVKSIRQVLQRSSDSHRPTDRALRSRPAADGRPGTLCGFRKAIGLRLEHAVGSQLRTCRRSALVRRGAPDFPRKET